MLVLGIESSCDETAAAVVDESFTMRSSVVASQIAAHRPFGGVVPELASRQHIRAIAPVVRQALADAEVEAADLDGVAATFAPGLIGSLLVGLQFAKAYAYAHGLPLIGINHLEGHLAAPRLTEAGARLPERHVALLVSGGHTALYLVERFGEYQLLGSTRDDAAGEAFDKVAKLLELGYPGGPMIEKLAASGDAEAIAFPRALPRRDDLDFSFSGLKTAVSVHLKRHGVPEGAARADLAASFQRAISDVLVKKTLAATRQTGVKAVVASGGVLANKAIRGALEQSAVGAGLELFFPPIALCTDNAAMIAAAGLLRLAAGERSDFSLNAEARLPL